jgi:transcriptional regulator with XRE-family HTH domain
VTTVEKEMSVSELRRRELGSFLRNRRERLRPEQVGLPPSRRRRTPGLRREEVAQLAGVGVTWYTWLEQAREIKASPQVLDAIARTLQFDTHEHAHLFTLAGLPTTSIADECDHMPPAGQLLVERLEPYPATVLNARWDLLAFNRTSAGFFPNLESIPLEERNCLWLAFTNPEWRKTIVDWDDSVRRMVAEYRSAMAEHIDDPAWQSLIDRLHSVSPEFTTVWERHDVLGVTPASKRLRHPTAGLFNFVYTNLWLDHRPNTRIVVLTPSDSKTSERLEALHRSLSGTAPRS